MVYKKIIPLLLLCFVFFCSQKKNYALTFEECVAKSEISFSSLKKANRWKGVKKLYDAHVLRSLPSENPRIPKIIHQIWLGSALPEKYLAIQKSWQDNHPDWEYYLWTDADVKTVKLWNQSLFDAAVNYGEKADILRYELLYQFGGLYVDTDFECIRPFDDLHHRCDFYAGLERVETKNDSPRLGNALIGAAPHHPILLQCLTSISGVGTSNCDLIQQQTGPGLLTRCFFRVATTARLRSVAFPHTYFYPLPARERDGTLGGAIKEKWEQPESYAIHYWDTSWIP